MKLHDLSPAAGSKAAKKRIGRGPGSGHGKTAGRGHKGQRSRTGFSQRLGFEGGQMPLVRRVPKRGFTNIFKKDIEIVNIEHLLNLEGAISPELLIASGLVRAGRPIKVLGRGEIDRSIVISANSFSAGARKKIEAAGGTCEVIDS
jgi:large subunit ribosomal protein L15